MTTRTIPYWTPKRSVADAIESAKAAAALGKLTVEAIDRVTYAPSKDGQPAWEVRLRVKGP